MRTCRERRASVLPESQGLFSLRYSPDGRALAALSFDSLRLPLFDLTTRTWKTLHNGALGWPSWSRDSRYLLFTTGDAVNRVRISDGHSEEIASTKHLPRGPELFGLY